MFCFDESGMGDMLTYDDHMRKLDAAVKAAIKAEREDCAKLCETGEFELRSPAWNDAKPWKEPLDRSGRCADAIRNRSSA